MKEILEARQLLDELYSVEDAEIDKEIKEFREHVIINLGVLEINSENSNVQEDLEAFITKLYLIKREQQENRIANNHFATHNTIGDNSSFTSNVNYNINSSANYHINLADLVTAIKISFRYEWYIFLLLLICPIAYWVYFTKITFNVVLRKMYTGKNFSQLKRLFLDEYISVNANFINLALMTHETYQQEKQFYSENNLAQTYQQASTLQWHKQLYKIKKPITLDTIFMPNEEGKPTPHHVLVEGGAGMGKTTLCHYLAYQWALGEDSELPDLAKRFAAVVWLPLPALVETIKTHYEAPKGLSTYHLIAEFIYQQAFFEPWQRHYKVEEIAAWLETLEQTGQLLYIFDGYDEIASWVGEPLWQNFFEKLWLKPDWLLTARPYSFSLRHAQDSRHLELLGFVDEDIPSYVQHFFAKEKKSDAAELIAKLEHNRSLWNVAHTPINLELLCIIWQENAVGSRERLFAAGHHVTLTSLYEQLLSFLVRRFIQKHPPAAELLAQLIPVSPQLGKLEQQYPGMPALLSLLEKLAWQGAEQGSNIFKNKDYKPLLSEAFQAGHYWELTTGEALAKIIFHQIGLLRSVGKRDELALNQAYEFLHPTFGEFLAARYLAKRIVTHAFIPIRKSEIIKPQDRNLMAFMCERRYEPSYFLLLSFTAGLLKIEGDFKKDYVGLNDFFTALQQSDQKDLVGWYDLVLQLRCLEECEVPSKEILPGSEIIKVNLISWLEKLLSKKYERISDLKRQLNNQLKATPLINEMIVVPWLLQLAESTKNTIINKTSFTKLTELDGLYDIWKQIYEVKAFCIVPDFLKRLLQATEEVERQIMIYTLAYFAKADEASCIVHTLLKLLSQTTDEGTQYVIIYAFLKLGKIEAAHIVPALLKLMLQTSNKKMRQSILCTLVQLGKAEAARIVPTLLDLLSQTSDKETRRTILNTLAQFDKTEGTRIVLSLLDLLLQTTDEEIRYAIVNVLGQVGKDEPAHIVPVLLDLLAQTTDEKTFYIIVKVLTQFGTVEVARILPILLDLVSKKLDAKKHFDIANAALHAILPNDNIAIRQLYLNTDESIRGDIINLLIENGSRLQNDKRLAIIFSDFFIQTNNKQIQLKIIGYIIYIHLTKNDKTILAAFLKTQQAQRLLTLDNEYDCYDSNEQIAFTTTSSMLVGISIHLLLEMYQQEPHPAYLSLVMQKCLNENQALSVVEQENYLEIRIFGQSKQASNYRVNKIYANHFLEARNAIPLLNGPFIDIYSKSNALTLAPNNAIELPIAVGTEVEKDEIPDRKINIRMEEYDGNLKKGMAHEIDSDYHFEDPEAVYPASGFENTFHTRKLLAFEEVEPVTSAANRLKSFLLPQYLISSLRRGYQQIINLLSEHTAVTKTLHQPLPPVTIAEQLYLAHYFIAHLQQSQFWPPINNKLHQLLQILPYYRSHNLSIKERGSLQSSSQVIDNIIDQIKHYQTTRVGISPIYREELLPILLNALVLANFITTLLERERASVAEITQINHKTQALQQTLKQLDIKKLSKILRNAEIKQARLERRSAHTGQTSTTRLLVCLNKHASNKWTIRQQTMDEKLHELWVDKPSSALVADKIVVDAILARIKQVRNRSQRANLTDDLHLDMSNKPCELT